MNGKQLLLALLVGLLVLVGLLLYFMGESAWRLAILPAVMLCIERGNTDLVVFFLLAGALALLSRLPALAVVITQLAAFLKLYPVLALGVLLREPHKAAASLMPCW